MTVDGAERGDSRCPSCDGPVGLRASYCMHCGRDLPDRTEYDDVTGQTEAAADDGGETLLTRLRPGRSEQQRSASIGEADTPAVVESDTGSIDADTGSIDADTGSIDADTGSVADRTVDHGSVEADRAGTDPRGSDASDESARRVGSGRDRSATSGRVPTPSGRGSDGPTLLRTEGLFEESAAASKLLGMLGVLGAVAVLVFGLSPPLTGALLSFLAWTVSVAVVGRRYTGFDAMRYGSYSMMILLIAVSFGFAFRSVAGDAVAVGLTLVPVAIAALYVAGFGHSVGAYEPG